MHTHHTRSFFIPVTLCLTSTKATCTTPWQGERPPTCQTKEAKSFLYERQGRLKTSPK